MSEQPKIRERIITILTEAGAPLGFEAIYAALEADGWSLPADKPKLKVRRILFDTETFTTEKGEYSLAGAEAYDGDTPAAAPAGVVIPELVNTAPPPEQVVEALEALTPEPEPAAPVPAAPAGGPLKWGLRQRIMTALVEPAEGLTFEEVYAALEQDGFPMPADKPKLKVRKILYDAEMFAALGKGKFVLQEGVTPPGPAPAPPPPGSQPAPAPTPAPKRKKPAPAGAPRSGMKPAMKPGMKPTMKPRPPAGKAGASRKPVASKPAPPASSGPKRPLRDRIITALNAAAKPMTFEEVYAALEKDGFVLPADKPKLKVRKVLFDKEIFASAGKGLYEVQPGVEAAPAPAAPAPAPATPSAAAAPVQPVSVAPIDPAAFANDPEVKAAAAQAAREAAEEARREAQAAIEAAKQAAVEQAKKAAIEAARKAAIEAARKTAVEEAKKAAIEAAKQAAVEQAREMAAQTAEAAQEAAAEAVKAAAAEAAEAARQAAQTAAQEAAKQSSAEIPAPQAAAPSATGTVNSATANQEALQASRRSGQGSLRERAATAIFKADKPLTADEVFDAVAKDGYPLPRNNPREVLQKVLDNRDLFALTDDGKYVPMVEE